MKRILLIVLLFQFIYSCTQNNKSNKKIEKINKEYVAKEMIGVNIVSKNPELYSKTGIDVPSNQMINKYLSSGEKIVFKGYEFTFNNRKKSALNFYSEHDKLMCETSTDLSIKNMPPDGKRDISYSAGDRFEVSAMTLITIETTKFLIKDIKYTE